jgi:nucleoside triphosphatase
MSGFRDDGKNMRMRVTVSGLIYNPEGEILLCKMPENRGAYPGQWAIPGGGIDEGEMMRETLVREIKEEVGLDVSEIVPLSFDDDVREKVNKDGSKETLYMIHLVFECRVGVQDIESLENNMSVRINDEFEAFVWVKPEDVSRYNLNEATMKTFKKKGWV